VQADPRAGERGAARDTREDEQEYPDWMGRRPFSELAFSSCSRSLAPIYLKGIASLPEGFNVIMLGAWGGSSTCWSSGSRS